MNRIILKKIRNWTISTNNDYYSDQIMVDDEYVSYYMNEDKAWDNFYPIPKDIIKWCETTGVKKLKSLNTCRK